MTAAAIDEFTAWALTAMPHADDNDIVRWFEVLHGAYGACQAEGDTGWEALHAHVAEHAAQQAFDTATVEHYLAALADTGQGAELVERMLALTDQMPGLYWQLQGGGQAAETAQPADPLGWVTPEQRAQLEAVWGTGWPDSLTGYLSGQWGVGWEQHPDEHKTAWLQDLIQSWSAQGETEAHAEPAAAHTEPAQGETAAAPVEPIPAEIAGDLVDAALREVLAETEGADELTAEEIAELRAEILEDVTATAAAE